MHLRPLQVFAGTGTAALLLGIGMPASAQAGAAPAPPAATAPTTEAKPGDKAPVEKKPPAPPTPIEVTISPEFGSQSVSGRRSDFYRYNRMPTGFYFGLLRALRTDENGAPLQQVWWRNPGQADEKGYLDLTGDRYPSYLRLWRDTSEFAGDPRAPLDRFSGRENTRLRLRGQGTDRGPAVAFNFWDQHESVPTLLRFAPFRGIDISAQDYSLTGFLPVGKGSVRLEPRVREATSGNPRTPDSQTTWLTSEIQYPLGSRLDVSAAYQQIFTRVAGEDQSSWSTFRLRGSYRPGSTLFLNAFYRNLSADLPFTQTAYADRSSLVGIDAAAYPLRRVSLRGGVFREDVRQQYGSSDRTEDAAWTGGWAHLRVSDPESWSFNLRLESRDLDGAPHAAVPGLPTRDSLYYSKHRSADARLDYFPCRWLSTYADYLWQQRDNDERGSRVSLNSFTLGAVSPLSDRLVATVEYTQQIWDGNTQPLRSGPGRPAGDLPPEFMFSNGRIATASLGYRLSRGASLDLSLNQFNSTGGQSSRDSFAVLQYRRDVSREFFYSLGYQYERFRGNPGDRGFTAFPLLVQVGFRREFR